MTTLLFFVYTGKIRGWGMCDEKAKARGEYQKKRAMTNRSFLCMYAKAIPYYKYIGKAVLGLIDADLVSDS